MAATYRIVVSTVNCYNSVVIDRRFQHTVHYCSGPCQVLKHGIECTVAHHSTCSELVEAPVAPASNARPSGAQELGNKFSAVENGNAAPEAMSEDYHQVLPGAPRIKKGLAIQGSTSLKDITGEAINLASGKIKEFSFEKIKYSSSHVTFRKGRKVRPDSFSRRSTDLDIIYGHFGNDENCPPFGMLQKSVMEEHKLSRSSSLEQNVNNVATLYLNSLTEENLINKILEKTKMDSNASGEDIKACLDILLKCSEDLKKCTDIIKQCIKRKSMGGESDDSSTNPELIYRNVMARLSSYLKKLPFEFEHGLPGRSEHNDLAELVNSLHGLQQSPFSPIFGNEQPPRYEDVVHSPPLTKTLPPSSLLESQEASREPVNNVKSVQSPSSLPSHPSSLANSSTSLPQVTAINHSDSYSSTNSLLSSSNDSICKESMEALYIEEDPDLGKVLDKELRGEGKFSLGFTEVKQFSKKPSTFAETSDGADKLSESISNGTTCKPKIDPHALQGASKAFVSPTNLSAESRAFQTLGHSNQEDDIDKLLMDLECLSQNMEQEPSMKGNSQQVVNCSQQPGSVQHLIFSSGSKSHPPPAMTSPLPGKKDTSRHGGDVNDEEDGALLLRILESIESFAQELVESGTGKGTLSREREVMRLLQDTLVTTAKSEQKSQPGPVPAVVRDTGPSLLIQQTPEVIRVQNKQEKKPGTPPPAPTSSTPSPRPPTPPPAHKVVVATSLSVNIPRFYFPKGLPNCSANLDETIAKIEAAFTEFEEEKADIYEMGKIAKACNCPLYWKAPMFNGTGGERTGFVSVHGFIATWRKLLLSCYDDASKFVYLLAKPGYNYLEQEDFIPLLQDVVDTHPGLTFLKDAPEFHSRYITTVIQRIFYTVNRSWSGRITMTELRKSNFLQTLALLEEEDDINQITDYFSYEHFYVIYCKFWELDTDHDLFIDQKDLARYNDHASSNRIIERIFSGAVTRGNSVQKEGRMSYADFVWFLISEEDKKNPTSVEYWFRCMDLDGDGVLSMYELEHFYEEQCERMEGMGIEPLPFHDLLCQMLDLVKPEQQGRITLHDLKRCRMAHIFYDTFFNLEKYLDHEQRDPFAVQKDADSEGGPEPSDWDKYAAEEYEILVAEESANEQLQEGSFEDDYESDELTVPPEIGNKMDKLVISDLSA
nr:PREDICTED: serine/threonine-protein phosphatase 2A regulatory subunit B'' subunit alpha isoform X2 [Lepisosteus oculatus]